MVDIGERISKGWSAEIWAIYREIIIDLYVADSERTAGWWHRISVSKVIGDPELVLEGTHVSLLVRRIIGDAMHRASHSSDVKVTQKSCRNNYVSQTAAYLKYE